MKIEEKVVETEKVYIADDGKRFRSKRACQIYEKYFPMTIYDIIKKYCIIVNKEDIIQYKDNKVPAFTYLIVKEVIPGEEEEYCNIIEKGNGKSGLPNIYKGDKPTLFYNNWANAMNGGYGKNGWESIGTKKAIKERLEYYKKCLEKIENGVDK